jgi:hypothetical protein
VFAHSYRREHDCSPVYESDTHWELPHEH